MWDITRLVLIRLTVPISPCMGNDGVNLASGALHYMCTKDSTACSGRNHCTCAAMHSLVEICTPEPVTDFSTPASNSSCAVSLGKCCCWGDEVEFFQVNIRWHPTLQYPSLPDACYIIFFHTA